MSESKMRAARRWTDGEELEVWQSASGDRRAVLTVDGRLIYLSLVMGKDRVEDALLVGVLDGLDNELVMGTFLSGYVEYPAWAERVKWASSCKYRVLHRKVLSSDSFVHQYFETNQEASREFESLLNSGHVGTVQHWNPRVQLWVG
jgi:hypothetical protein